MRRPRNLPKRTASLEPLNGVDLRELVPEVIVGTINHDDTPQQHFPLLRLVMNKASEKYVGMIVQLAPLPNKVMEKDETIYTLAVKGSKLLGTDGPGALEWRTVAEGTLPELLKVVSKEE